MASEPAPATVLYFLVAIDRKKKCTLDPITVVSTIDLGEPGVMLIIIFF